MLAGRLDDDDDDDDDGTISNPKRGCLHFT